MNTTSFVRSITFAAMALTALFQQLRADMTNTDSFVILSGGPSGAAYYYTVKGSSANTSFSSINQSVNLLASPAITLNGGEVKTTASGGDYQNTNNYETVYYRFYNSGSSAPSYTSMSLNFVGENPSYPNYKWDKTGQSTAMLTDSESSGTYYMDVYFTGNASYFSGSQQYYTSDANTASSSGSPSRATFNLFYGATGAGTQSAAFSGTGYFNLNASGATYTLNQANTYTGETQIDAGTLAVSGSLSSSSAVYVGNGGNASDAALSLSGTTTLANNVTVNPSTGSGTRTISKTDATAQEMSGSVTLNRNASIDVSDASGSLTMSGGVGGGNALTKTGSGTLTLSGANSFSGTTTIGSGTLAITNGSAIANSGVVTLSNVSGATFAVNASETIGSLQGGGTTGGNVSIASGQTLTVAETGSQTFGGVISNAGSLTKSGAGTLALTNSSTYTGTTTVTAGTLSTTLAMSSTNYVLNGGSFITSGANRIAETAAITLSGGDLQLGNNTIGRDGTVTLTAATTSSLRTASSSTTTVRGKLTGSGNLIKYGAGNLYLTNANNDFSGAVTLREGTIMINTANGFGTASLQIGNGTTNTTFQVSNNVTSAAGLSISNSSTAGVVEVGSGFTYTQSGNLTQAGGTDNATKFGKAGAGTLLLSGTGSSYGGQLQIGNGTVIVAQNNALSTNTTTSARGIDLGLNVGDTNLANNVAVLGRNGVTISNSIYVAQNTNDATRTIGLDGTGTTTFNNEIYLDGTLTATAASGGNAIISGNIVTNISGAGGGLTKAGAGTVTLAGANTYNGATAVGAGTLLVNGSAANSVVTVSNSATLGGSGTVGATTLLSGSTIAPGNSAGTLNINGAHAWNEGANYEWEIFNLDGPAGTGWDLLSVTGGTLNLTGITTAGGFTINLVTLQADNSTQGALTDFDPNANYTNWLIASAPTISGFSTNLFNLDSSLFAGATGTFGIEQRAYGGGQGLFLTYNGGSEPIPEPGTWAAAALLAGTAGLVGWRRRRARSGQQAA